MIFTERQITVRKGKATIDEPVILYRGDYEVSIKFTIMESKFRFKSGVNLVDSEKASFGQLAILAPYGGNVFSEIVKCEDGTVTFTLTQEMMDQLEEVGLYSFQIRLFDYYRESRVSIPPVEFGIEVREPVASEDHDNEVNNAIVGYSIAKVMDGLNEDVGDTFDDNGQYNKTDWKTGDRISEGKLNKIEDALDKINQNEINDKNTLNKQMTSNFNVLQNQIDNMVIESGNTDIEVEQARGEYNLLSQRLNAMDETDVELGSQLTQNVNQLTLSSGSSDGIVHFNYDEVDDYFQGKGVIESNSDYEEIINLFDSYINQNSDYISKENLGKDSSGKNNIYSYILTPECYANTVIIIAGVHGNEKCSAYSCLELIKQLTNSNRNNMQYLRHNTQFVILPIANPWGYINHTRTNYNGVDINRNFDYKFTASTENGSKAFSEEEAQYIRDLLYKYKENCDLVIDLHHYATPTATTLNQASGHQYTTWTTRWSNNYFEEFRNILKTLSDSYDIATGGTSSSIDNYVNTKLKIPAVTCEIDMGLLSQYCYGKTSIIHQLNMLVNYSLVTTRKNKFTLETDGFVTRLIYGTDPRATNKFTVVNNTTEKAVDTPFTYSFDIPTSGYVEVDGLVEVELLDTSTRVSLIPRIGQVGGDQLGSEDWYNHIYESYNYNPFTRYSTNETIIQTIPIKALTRVISTNAGAGKCDFSLMVWQYNPLNVDMYIRKFHIFLKYTPSNVGLSVKSITFDKDNNPKQTYPDEKYFV